MKYPAPLQAAEQLAGLDEAPKGMNGKIGISERGKVKAWSWSHSNEALTRKTSCITCLYLTESDAIVPVKRR